MSDRATIRCWEPAQAHKAMTAQLWPMLKAHLMAGRRMVLTLSPETRSLAENAMPLCADAPGRIGCHSLFDHYALLPGGRAAHVEQGKLWSAQTRAQINALGLWPATLPQIDDKGQP